MRTNFRLFILLPIMFGSLTLTACQTLPMPSNTLQQQVNQTVIVMFEPTVDKVQLQHMIASYHGNITQSYSSLNGMAIRFPQGTNMTKVMAEFSKIRGVRSVEMDKVQTIQ